jgi:hypothetical protein
MIVFSVTVKRPNGTTMIWEFKCPLERAEWIKNQMPLFLPEGTRVIEYRDDAYIEDDPPPKDETHWYTLR